MVPGFEESGTGTRENTVTNLSETTLGPASGHASKFTVPRSDRIEDIEVFREVVSRAGFEPATH